MPLVTVKPKFQVTIPAKLREQITLHEGDVLDAVLVQEGILLRPRAVTDKHVAAEQLKAIFAHAPTDARDESLVMQDVISDIAAYRAEKRR
ncbi:MAG: AbrB/MazE/SpoVT family DNA-binding domain-containing protein [Methylobacillus sp.]|jgi:AbrB family looped-hinge helix DNA binding protein|nr:AbrB/MazE/SpoVT family DNA-binding domain-containing protein [Methylobacillus sp.]